MRNYVPTNTRTPPGIFFSSSRNMCRNKCQTYFRLLHNWRTKSTYPEGVVEIQVRKQNTDQQKGKKNWVKVIEMHVKTVGWWREIRMIDLINPTIFIKLEKSLRRITSVSQNPCISVSPKIINSTLCTVFDMIWGTILNTPAISLLGTMIESEYRSDI